MSKILGEQICQRAGVYRGQEMNAAFWERIIGAIAEICLEKISERKEFIAKGEDNE